MRRSTVPGVSPRSAARQLAVSRVIVGLALIVKPQLVTSLWVGRPTFRAPARVLARALGIRDAAIGLGLLAALGGRGSPRPWLIAGTVADAFDIAATVAESDSLPGTAVPVVVAAGGTGAALGAYALTGVDDS
jgi:hypothetical protein